MRVVVVGATGNVGTSVVRALSDDDAIEKVIGLARRVPALVVPKVQWRRADIISSDLVAEFPGAVRRPSGVGDPALARFTCSARGQCGRVDPGARRRDQSGRADSGLRLKRRCLLARLQGTRGGRSWPTHGIETSFYSRHKAEVESLLDEFEHGEPGVRVIRMRPALIFKRDAATEIRRLFLGPFVPRSAFSRRVIAGIPDIGALRFQAVTPTMSQTPSVARWLLLTRTELSIWPPTRCSIRGLCPRSSTLAESRSRPDCFAA